MANQNPSRKGRRLGMTDFAVAAVAVGLLLWTAHICTHLPAGHHRRRASERWIAPADGTIVKGFGGMRMRMPVVIYPGAEVEEMTSGPRVLGRRTFAVILGTSASPADVARYYVRELKRFGALRVRTLPPLREARALDVRKGNAYATVAIFRGPRKARNPFLVSFSDEGEETKVLILTSPPEQ